MTRVSPLVLAMSPMLLGWGGPVNPGSAVVQDFEKRVDGYVQLRKAAEGKLPKMRSTESAVQITQYQRELGRAMMKERASARQGDIFTPEVDKEFRRLMGFAMQPGDATRIRKSMNSAEPVTGRPQINQPYPDPGVTPLQSTPPSILLNLPHLPKEMEYRFVSHTLILLDTRANLIVDYMTNVGP